MPVETPRWFLEAINTPYEQGEVVVAGCPIRFLRWGDDRKPGLVFVHGGAANAHWWSFIAPQLTRHYHVVALDLSGHGDSGRRDTYPAETWADEVMAVIEGSGIEGRPIVVGHSMGGFVCMMSGMLYGEQLAGAVILDSPVRRPDPEAEEGAHGVAFRNPKVYASIESAVARYKLVPAQPCANRYIVDHIARNSLKAVPGGFTWKFDPEIFYNRRPRAAHEVLPKVRCRVALMRAEYGMVTPDIGDYMYDLLGRNAPVIEIPDAYHHLMLDQPLAVIAALRALLADWEHSIPRRIGHAH